jgi:GMC oxidoreductase
MLTDPRDLAALRRSMEITRELGNSEAMKPFVKREILPGDLEGEALDNLIRDGAMSMHHPTCTAKMGQDDLSVVDAQLRAYGVKKLRIADGSIMPTITTGNTHADRCSKERTRSDVWKLSRLLLQCSGSARLPVLDKPSTTSGEHPNEGGAERTPPRALPRSGKPEVNQRGRSARFEPQRGRQDFGAHHLLRMGARQVSAAGPGD